jgi:arylsulfatase A-like enzyme
MRALDDRLPTLAEVLTERGYATAGFVGNLTFANHNYGLDRGFARFEDYPVSFWQIVFSSGLGRRLASIDGLRRGLGLDGELNRVPAAEVTDRFLRWHEGRDSHRPFFAFLNYFDAHEPLRSMVEAGPVVPLTYRNSLVTGESIHFQIPPGYQNRFFEVYRQAYEAAIGQMDREVGRLVESLKEDGDLDRTLVIVASDHGELIGEYNLFGHESSLYQPTLWVPLVMRLPGRTPAGTHVTSPVSTRDLAATILDLVGQAGATGSESGPVVGPPAPIPGRSLASQWGPAADTTTHGPAYAYLRRGPSPRVAPWAPVVRGPQMESVIDGSMQYILNGDGSEELYPVGIDPSRAVNLAGEARATGSLRELRMALAELWPLTTPGFGRRPPRMGGTFPRVPAMP